MATVMVVSRRQELVAQLTRLRRKGIDIGLLGVMTDLPFFLSYCNESKIPPDLLVLDFDMQELDCMLAIEFLAEQFPSIRVIVPYTPSMHTNLLRLLKVGVWGLLLDRPVDLQGDIPCLKKQIVLDEGCVLGVVDSCVHVRRREERASLRKKLHITKREGTFILLNATGMEYAEIAKLMFIERKTVENIFNQVSRKLGIRNRHNLTLFSIRYGLASIMVETPLA